MLYPLVRDERGAQARNSAAFTSSRAALLKLQVREQESAALATKRRAMSVEPRAKPSPKKHLPPVPRGAHIPIVVPNGSVQQQDRSTSSLL